MTKQPSTPASRPSEDAVAPAGRQGRQPTGFPEESAWNSQTQAVATAFLGSLDKAIGPLQRSVKTLLTLAASELSSPTELCRAFGIARIQAWRVWRLAHARSAAEAAKFVTGTTALENFLTAGARYGAEKALLEAVRQTYRGYQEFVKETAGDEATLRLMVEAASGDESPVEGSSARSAFEVNRLRVGVQAASVLYSFYLFPSQLEGISSAAAAVALADCWWLRPDTQAVFSQATLSREGHETPTHLSTPLDPELAARQELGENSSPSLIGPFCRGDSTAMLRQRCGNQIVNALKPLRMGADHKTTLCYGDIKHACFIPLDQYPCTSFTGSTFIPTEQFVVEVYVHRELVRRGYEFRPLITDKLFRPPEMYYWAPRFDLATLGGTFQIIEPTELIDSPVKAPPYREFAAFVFNRIEQPRGDFFCYRLQLPTPPLALAANLVVGQDPDRITTTCNYPR